MFQGIKKLFGSKKEKEQILAPVAGQAVPLSEVPDPAFAQEILGKGVGGPENVTSIDNCITRLRLEVKDYTKVNEKVIKSAGVAGVIRPSKTAVQVIIGTQVQFVADEFKKLCK